MLEFTGERFLPWHSDIQMVYEHLHRYAVAARFVSGKKVLDLASGEGYGSNLLANTAAQVVGVDIEPRTVQHAANTYIRPNLTFLEGSILNVPIAGQGRFDVITCFEALEHVADHTTLMNEVKRLLKPDGIFFVSTPNKITYSDERHYENHFHVKELYFDEFRKLLGHYFSQATILGQRILDTSIMWPVMQFSETVRDEFLIEKGRREFSFASRDKRAPTYFIALASNSATALNVEGSLLGDVSDCRMQQLRADVSANLQQNEQIITDLRSHNVELITKQRQELEKVRAQVFDLEAKRFSAVEELEQAQQKLVSQAATLDRLRHSRAYRFYLILQRIKRAL